LNTYSFAEFGCKSLKSDGEALRSALEKLGIFEALGSDILIINGCAVTARAEQKAFKYIRSFLRNNPNARVVISGCLARRLNMKNFPISEESLNNIIIIDGFSENLLNLFTNTETTDKDRVIRTRTRPLVKIQDGCSNFCSYCIVPFLRGPEKSFNPEDIIKNINHFDKKDHFEVVLTGIHICRYNYNGISLLNLVQMILNKTAIKRIRLSSLEPDETKDELLELIAQEKRIAKYLHLPLQSGSDRILKLMGRKYLTEDFRKIIEHIHNLMPDSGIGIDIISGFPTETEEEAEETRCFIESLPITNIHVFTYSERPGTRSCDLHPKIDISEKKERTKKLLKLRESKRQMFYNSFIDKDITCLIENFDKKHECYKGITGNYIQCICDKDNLIEGTEVIVKGTRYENGFLMCR
jgi:threonylcarbamoyladenosine tRNA methylthiotransferase MtaB